jgi:IclR family transcriptional regulator, acetate operon repressor
MVRANPAATHSAAARAFALIERVARAERPPTLAELGEALALPKATVHRIARELEHESMLTREPGGKRYTLGPRFTQLAAAALINSSHRGERHAIMQRLVDEIGETCNFTVLDGNHVLYLDRVEAHWPLRMHLQPGSRVPLHCTASGKLFLAHVRAAARARMIGALTLERRTPNTLTEPARLERALEKIRAQKIGTDNEEFLTGLVAVAVPVCDSKKRILAALAIHAPTARLPFEQALAHVPRLRAAAEALSVTLAG